MTHSKTKLALPLVILLHAGTGVADDSHAHAPLDLRMPDLSSPVLPLMYIAEPEEISVLGAGSAEDSELTSSFHFSRTGVGSFYWAARHPEQGWRILLPAVSDYQPILVEDLRVERAIFAEQFPRELTNDMAIAREEIFGPVLSIITYRDTEEAISIANDTNYGLQAYVFSAGAKRARELASQIEAGRVLVNTLAHEPAAPFGGFKHSDIGREYGTFGLEAFLEPQAILAAS